MTSSSTAPINTVNVMDPFYYSGFSVCFLLSLWVTSKLIEFVSSTRYLSSSKIYNTLSEDKKRNVVTYVLELLVTTLAFVTQVYAGSDILFRRKDITTPEKLDWGAFSLQCIALLYVWELIYRQYFGWPLLVHHLVTLLFIQLNIPTFYEEQQIVYLRVALMLGFYATTEQLSFVALYCYRLGIAVKYQPLLFLIAAIITGTIKCAVTIGATITYFVEIHTVKNSPWGGFWQSCFLLLLSCLFIAQIYATGILFVLSKRCRQRNNDSETQEQGRQVALGAADTKDDDASDHRTRDTEYDVDYRETVEQRRQVLTASTDMKENNGYYRTTEYDVETNDGAQTSP